MNIKYTLAIIIGLALQSLFTNRATTGSYVSQIGGTEGGCIMIRDDGENIAAVVDVPNTPSGGYAIDYTNGDNTDPANIKTTKGRYFDHLWMSGLSYPMWASAYDVNTGLNYPVNATTIRAYWDNYYANLATGYGNTGTGVGVAENCHGYSMGYNTWVEDNSYIVADDFTNASGWSDCTELIKGNDHSVEVLGYSQAGPWEGIFLYGFSTAEKIKRATFTRIIGLMGLAIPRVFRLTQRLN